MRREAPTGRADGRPPPAPPPDRRALFAGLLVLGLLGSLGGLVAALTLIGAYLAPLFGRGWVHVVVTAGLTLLLPAAVAGWLVRPLRGAFRRTAWIVGVYATLPLLAVLGLSLGLAKTSSRLLRERGLQTFEQVFGSEIQSGITRAARPAVERWADLLDLPKHRAREAWEGYAAKTSELKAQAVYYGGVKRPPRVASPAAPDSRAGLVARVPYQQKGGAMLVKARIRATPRDKTFTMILDTGATLSSINRETAAELGLRLPKAPVQTDMQTAAGPTSFPVVIVDAIGVGQAEVRNLTVALCDPCTPPGIAGLVGLNFTSHFVSTIDPERRQVSLHRRKGEPNRLDDVEPFLQLKDVAGEIVAGTFTVTGRLANLGPRPILHLKLTVVLLGSKPNESGALYAQVERALPGKATPFRVAGPAPAWLTRYRLELVSASW